jgi:PilZ domain
VSLEAVKRRREKRSGRRYPVHWKLHGRGISFLGFRHGDEEALNGRVLNINRGGLCLLTEQPIEKSAVLQCEIFPSGQHVGIPTVMEVRWMLPNPDGRGTSVGLRFLI